MTKVPARSSSGLFAACGVLAMVFGLTHCGGSSGTARDAAGTGGSSSTGTGGSASTGTGGSSTGTGGSSTTGTGGTGGSTGTGGTGGNANPALSCTPGVSPAAPLITNFGAGSWSNITGKWGMAGNLTGGTFAYHGPMTGTTMTSMVAAEALTLSGNVAAGDYAGGGLSFDQCVNTTAYTGVQVTLGGTTAGCDVLLQIQTYSQQGTGNRGGCDSTTTSCYHFPQLKVAVGAPVTVHFADLANTGMPVAAADIAKEIVGLQFQFQVPGAPDGGVQSPCTGVAMTIDDLSFVSN